MSDIQLVLRAEDVDVDTRRPVLTKADLGLVKLAPGPERLLGELLRRGMDHEHLITAAVIVLELEERAIR